MVIIRSLRDTDDAEWLRLRRALWDYDVEEIRREMAVIRADPDQQPVFVAERPQGGLCGLVEVTIHSEAPGCDSGRIGYLEAWYVDPDHRHQGIGRLLVEVAEAWARSMGCREMASDTHVSYPISPAAHAALGYQIVDIYFRKDLD